MLPRRSISSGSNSRAQTNAVSRFTRVDCAHDASSVSSALPTPWPPAFATSTSTRPNAARASSSARRTSCASAASPATAIAAAPSGFATASSGSRRRPSSTTLPPASTNLRATAAPMPVPPPVINATLSLNVCMTDVSFE